MTTNISTALRKYTREMRRHEKAQKKYFKARKRYHEAKTVWYKTAWGGAIEHTAERALKDERTVLFSQRYGHDTWEDNKQ